MEMKGISRTLILGGLGLIAIVGVVTRFLFEEQAHSGSSPPVREDAVVEDLVASEEWIALMSGAMNTVGCGSAQEGQGGLRSLELMEGSFTSGRGTADGWPEHHTGAGGVRWTDYRFGGEGNGQPFWWFLEEDFHRVEQVKWGFLSGAFENDERTAFQARVICWIRGAYDEGQPGAFECEQVVRWKLVEGGTRPARANDYLIVPSEWEIVGWQLDRARMMSGEAPLFREVTTEVIPDEGDLERVEVTDHSRYLDTLFSGGKIPLKAGYGRYFTTDATAQHPGISVVDINGDGLDDLYVCVRWGRNLLFQDRGDGTFEEVAAEYRLDLEGLSTSAVFADFDNDGDQDVFVGRSLERCVYLRNEGGVFRDCSESHLDGPLPYLTTSLTAADYDGDGFLDLYLSTYGFAIRQPRDRVARDFLQDYPEDEVERRFVNPDDVEPYLNLPGPPNVLLRNDGKGGFEVSPLSAQLAVWRETLQSTWADYDLDGDPDLYVCNDFAPDQLFRNDRGAAFVEVTGEIGHERMRGFGMGASFGDFDNDLDLDLYVSNMFSKAGLRILDQVGSRDERFRWAAEGNLLFANQGGSRFEFVSGKGAPFEEVAKADWSWGGQFADFDNDGFLDLYVPNGYFTAPEAYAGEVDL